MRKLFLRSSDPIGKGFEVRATLLHNPDAGEGSAPAAAELVSLLEDAGWRVAYQSTRKDFETALRDPGDLVVVAGGDGTVGKVARRLLGRGVPMALLPVGTANNIARSLGVLGLPEVLVPNWDLARRVSLDVGYARGPWGKRPFLEGVGFGLFPRVMAGRTNAPEGPDDEREKLQGDLRALRDAVAEHPSRRCSVWLDGHDFSGSYLLVEVMNIPFLGPNAKLAKAADPGDGFFDVVLGSEGDRACLLRYLEDRLRGTEPRLELPTRRVSRARIFWDGPDIRVDDALLEALVSAGETSGGPGGIVEIEPSPHVLEFLAAT